ncbi:MAG: creatininase family protein, partial [Dehalococcoidia bacterium]
MLFTDFTYEELRELQPEVQAVLIPLGCTEQQGPHMRVDFDTRMVTRLCVDAAAVLDGEGRKILVLPGLPFGPTPEHRGFGHGYVNLRQSTHEAIVLDILNSLAEQEYRRLIVWRGCGQHELGRPIQEFNASSSVARAYQPLSDYGAICDIVLGPGIIGGHADS